MIPPVFIPAKRNYREKKMSSAALSAEPLTLISAQYNDGESIVLAFDQPIDISAINPEVFIVDDQHLTDGQWGGTNGATLLEPTVVQIPLELLTAATEPGVHLDVASDNGIVSTSGAAWAGVVFLELPYP